MKLSAQEEYGLRCLLQIAREPAGFLTIPELASREGLTVANVAKIMSVLRQGGLVRSTRGQNGGYQLVRPAAEIDLSTVLVALGGQLYSDEFCGRFVGTEKVCVHNIDCAIRSLWSSVEQIVQDALSRKSLADLVTPAVRALGPGGTAERHAVERHAAAGGLLLPAITVRSRGAAKPTPARRRKPAPRTTLARRPARV